MRKISYTVYLDTIQIDKLRERSKETGIPQSKIVRNALDKHLGV